MSSQNEDWRGEMISLSLSAHYIKKMFPVRVSPGYLIRHKDDPGFPKPIKSSSPQKYFFGEIVDWVFENKTK